MMPYIGSMMFYAHAKMLVFSQHAQDVLLLYAYAYWKGGSEHIFLFKIQQII